MAHQRTPTKIAIVGAGPAGLTLARVLHINFTPQQLDVTIYEADTSSASRGSQGGTLDLHADSGQAALRACGLYEAFTQIMRPEGEALRISDKSGRLWHCEEDSEQDRHDRPEVDRRALRDLLLSSLPDGMVRWGYRVQSAVYDSSTPKSCIVFANGEELREIDLLVGADGAWSKVRSLLTRERPFYSGLSCIEVRLPDVETRYPAIAEFVGAGSHFSLSDEKGLIAQRNRDGSVRTYAVLKKPEDWLRSCGIDFTNRKAAVKEVVNREFSDWTSQLQQWLLAVEDFVNEPLRTWALHMLPVGHRWEHTPGVTLLGDAAHLMTPFAGEGVNMAMLDALRLADSIRKESGSLTGAISLAEEKMFVDAEEKAAETKNNMDIFFEKDSPSGFVRLMERLVGGPSS